MLFVKRVLVLGLLFGDPHLSKPAYCTLGVHVCFRAASFTRSRFDKQ